MEALAVPDFFVLGGYAAENRGADFVQHLVLSPCARTRHWPRLRFSGPQGASTMRPLRCSRISAAIRRSIKVYAVSLGGPKCQANANHMIGSMRPATLTMEVIAWGSTAEAIALVQIGIGIVISEHGRRHGGVARNVERVKGSQLQSNKKTGSTGTGVVNHPLVVNYSLFYR